MLIPKSFKSSNSTNIDKEGEENTVQKEKENLVNFCTRQTDLID